MRTAIYQQKEFESKDKIRQLFNKIGKDRQITVGKDKKAMGKVFQVEVIYKKK